MWTAQTAIQNISVGPRWVVENDFVCWLMSIEDWDAMVASLGPMPLQVSGRVERRYMGVVTGQSLTEPLNASLAHVGPSESAMDAERRNLERLGRKVAFWAIFGLAVTIITWEILR